MNQLIYWQENRAAAYFMAQFFINDGDYQAAIYWQEYAAYCHNCFLCNQDMMTREGN